jgi:hypothetical protein
MLPKPSKAGFLEMGWVTEDFTKSNTEQTLDERREVMFKRFRNKALSASPTSLLGPCSATLRERKGMMFIIKEGHDPKGAMRWKNPER